MSDNERLYEYMEFTAKEAEEGTLESTLQCYKEGILGTNKNRYLVKPNPVMARDIRDSIKHRKELEKASEEKAT